MELLRFILIQICLFPSATISIVFGMKKTGEIINLNEQNQSSLQRAHSLPNFEEIKLERKEKFEKFEKKHRGRGLVPTYRLFLEDEMRGKLAQAGTSEEKVKEEEAIREKYKKMLASQFGTNGGEGKVPGSHRRAQSLGGGGGEEGEHSAPSARGGEQKGFVDRLVGRTQSFGRRRMAGEEEGNGRNAAESPRRAGKGWKFPRLSRFVPRDHGKKKMEESGAGEEAEQAFRAGGHWHNVWEEPVSLRTASSLEGLIMPPIKTLRQMRKLLDDTGRPSQWKFDEKEMNGQSPSGVPKLRTKEEGEEEKKEEEENGTEEGSRPTMMALFEEAQKTLPSRGGEEEAQKEQKEEVLAPLQKQERVEGRVAGEEKEEGKKEEVVKDRLAADGMVALRKEEEDAESWPEAGGGGQESQGKPDEVSEAIAEGPTAFRTVSGSKKETERAKELPEKLGIPAEIGRRKKEEEKEAEERPESDEVIGRVPLLVTGPSSPGLKHKAGDGEGAGGAGGHTHNGIGTGEGKEKQSQMEDINGKDRAKEQKVAGDLEEFEAEEKTVENEEVERGHKREGMVEEAVRNVPKDTPKKEGKEGEDKPVGMEELAKAVAVNAKMDLGRGGGGDGEGYGGNGENVRDSEHLEEALHVHGKRHERRGSLDSQLMRGPRREHSRGTGHFEGQKSRSEGGASPKHELGPRQIAWHRRQQKESGAWQKESRNAEVELHQIGPLGKRGGERRTIADEEWREASVKKKGQLFIQTYVKEQEKEENGKARGTGRGRVAKF